MSILIKNGCVADDRKEIKADVLIEDGRITRIGHIDADADRVIDAEGLTVMPSFVEMHAHQGDAPATLARAALAGGYTRVALLPDSDPPIDGEMGIRYIRDKYRGLPIEVFPIGGISKGLKGEELSEMGKIAGAGAAALSDVSGIKDPVFASKALRYARLAGVPLMFMPEDCGGLMNEGNYSTLYGLAGIPAEIEEILINIMAVLSEREGVPVHIMDMSTAASLEDLCRGREQGAPITADVTPYHLVLDESEMGDYDTTLKINPPLRGRNDVEALRDAVRQGRIDAISSDHRPKSKVVKNTEFAKADFGISGIETAFPIIATYLLGEGVIGIKDLVRLMSVRPAEILGQKPVRMEEGGRADIVIADMDREFTLDGMISESNNPFLGSTLTGTVMCTIASGEVAWERSGSYAYAEISGGYR